VNLDINESISAVTKVSVVMPVYNVEAYVQEAIDSVLEQTLPEIELICVDDCSSDGSLAILRAAAEKDNRVHIVTYEKNKGTFDARREGIRSATGKYIMFLDSDDALYPTACQTVWQKMEGVQADILLFHSHVSAVYEEGAQEALQLQEKLNTRAIPEILDENLALHCFRDHQFTYTVWNKAYRADLCKTLLRFDELPQHMIVSEDLVFSMIILYQAQKMVSSESVLYHYYLGRGVTGQISVSAEKFAKLCSGVSSYRAVRMFLAKMEALPIYSEIVSRYYEEFLCGLIYTWMERVTPRDAVQAWQSLVSNWGAVDVIRILTTDYASRMNFIQSRLRIEQRKPEMEKPVKHIGLYYYRISNGGVERVTSTVIPMWLSKGYQVTLITEKEPDPEDYPIPDGVKRLILPEEASSFGSDYLQRAMAWEKIIRENQIDTIVDEAHVSKLLPWDALLLKSLGCNLIIWSHSSCSFLMRSLASQPMPIVNTYYMADRIVTLSPVFSQFWGCFAPSCFIPNPSHTRAQADIVRNPDKNILWVGRISVEKNPYDVLNAFAAVLKKVPDATLTLVGKAETEKAETELRATAEQLGIAERVCFVGFHAQVDPFYRKAAVMAMTSSYEGYGLVLAEAKSFGVPVVMYDLPYLSQVLDSRGVVTVPQLDIASMADKLIELLQNETMRQQIGQKGLEAASDLDANDYAGAWDRLFQSFGKPLPEEWLVAKNQKIMVNQFMKDLDYGLSCYQSIQTVYHTQYFEELVDGHNIGWYAAQCNSLNDTIEEIRKSFSYRIGCLIMRIPQLIKDMFRNRKKG